MPKKSIAPCAGRPLLAYTCDAALASNRLGRVILSTDDEEIAAAGRACNIEVPFLRPKELAADDTPMIAVMRHALEWLEQAGETITALVLLQPTSPLRRANHIDEAIDLLFNTGANTVVSVVEVPHQFNPVSVLRMKNGYLDPFVEGQPLITRRQDKPKAYARNGPAVLVARPDLIRANCLYGARTMGYLMAAEDSLDVDDLADLEAAERRLARR
jgi:CMP-N-acetylneuraminic acid synthetase